MAKRWQIMQRTNEGMFRVTCDCESEMQRLVEEAQQNPECRYIVVKDRVRNRRGLVWRRSQATEIDWWILAEPETVSIEFRSRRRR